MFTMFYVIVFALVFIKFVVINVQKYLIPYPQAVTQQTITIIFFNLCTYMENSQS